MERDGKKQAVFQLVQLIQVHDRDQKLSYQLRRALYTFDTDSNSFRFYGGDDSGDPFLMERIAAATLPAGGEPGVLELRVEGSRMKSISWNGNVVPELAEHHAEHPDHVIQYAGDWGLFTRNNVMIKSIGVITFRRDVE